MRIHRISLRNYRGIVEREVVLPETGVTILEGANELGKTSMVDAIDLLLEELDSSTKHRVKAAKPTNRDVGTEVEAEFSSGPYRFIYRKRWNRRHETVLRIIEPHPHQLTGRPAHERVMAILDETLDRGLWKALRVEQRQPVQQAALGDNDQLAQALDVASGNVRETGRESNLYQRVEAAYREFFTSTGKPTGDYRATAELRPQTAAALASSTDRVEEVERDVAQHRELRNGLVQLKSQQNKHSQRLLSLEADWSELEKTKAKCEELRIKTKPLRGAADSAFEAYERRKADAVTVNTKANEIAELRADAAAQGGTKSAAERLLAVTYEEHVTLGKALNEADRTWRCASDDVAHLRDCADVGDLSDRRKRLKEARNRIQANASFIATCRVSDVLLENFEQAHIDTAKATAALQAASPTIVIDAISAGEVRAGAERVALDPGVTFTRIVTEETAINIPGVLRLRVLPGAGERHPFEVKREADNRLRALCESAGVADVAAAKEMNRRLRTAEHDSTEAYEMVRQALSGLTAEELNERIMILTLRIDAYQQQRGMEPTLPPNIDSAVASEQTARERREAAQEQLAACTDLLEERRTVTTQLSEEMAIRDARIATMCAEHARLRQQLLTARNFTSDQRLAQDLAYTREDATRAEGELASLKDALAALDPEILTSRLANARQVRDRMIREREEGDRDLNRLTGKLEMAGSEGRQDIFDAAKSAAASVESIYRALHLRAEAAKLLYQTMTERRGEAKRSYLAPFRIRLEKLGRIVFGSDLQLEVDGELSIVSRTLGGVTVGYNDLSAGAQEQLCLISRLACADVVDPVDGVPVIVDDALGHSDPHRLERLGAVFAASAASTQIIVLTCVPERFRGIGSAHVIQLTRSAQPSRIEQDGVVATAPTAAVDLDTSATAIIEYLGRADRPLGKNEILAGTGLTTESWPKAIKDLLEDSQIVRIGERRGATYRIAR